MLIPKIHIAVSQITQIANTSKDTTSEAPAIRNTLYEFGFCNEFTNNSDWTQLGTTSKIIMPIKKLITSEGVNLYNNGLKSLINYDVNFPSKVPAFMVGDLMFVSGGYIHPETLTTEQAKIDGKYYLNSIGVIRGLSLSDTLEIEYEGLEYTLKQIQMPNKTIKKGEDVIGLIRNVLEKSHKRRLAAATTDYQRRFLGVTKLKVNFVQNDGFIDKQNQTWSFDNELIISGNMTVAQFLEMLRSKYYLTSYVFNNILNIGFGPQYINTSMNSTDRNGRPKSGYNAETGRIEAAFIPIYPFSFQKNIIESKLEYKDKNGIRLAAVVSNTFVDETGTLTKDGHKKTKNFKISVYISISSNLIDPTGVLQSDAEANIKFVVLQDYNKLTKKVTKNEKPIETEDTEIRDFAFPDARTIADLKRLGVQQLLKYYYTGYRGSFTTFGEPVCQIGNIIQLIDDESPEKNGFYRIRGIKRTFGMGGYRQEVELDIKVSDSIKTNSGFKVFDFYKPK